MISKEEALQLIDDAYEKWRDQEELNYSRGLGYTGPDAYLIRNYSFEQIFNELMVRLSYGKSL